MTKMNIPLENTPLSCYRKMSKTFIKALSGSQRGITGTNRRNKNDFSAKIFLTLQIFYDTIPRTNLTAFLVQGRGD